jgi:alanine racemase
MRSLSNRGVLQVGEFSAPIVGRVSMDLMTIDVGHVPEHLARPGAMVKILGSSQDADELGRSAGTIGYEVLTALGRRCRRVHRKVG